MQASADSQAAASAAALAALYTSAVAGSCSTLAPGTASCTACSGVVTGPAVAP